MYTFIIKLSDCTEQKFEHITEIQYTRAGGGSHVIVKGEEILKHYFALKSTLHLYSDNCNVTINLSNAIYVAVTKED